jgi:predicted nucleic acid-binding protein
VDTFFWIALADPRDAFHSEAVALLRKLDGASFVTTDEVLVEFLTFFAQAGPNLRGAVVALVRSLLTQQMIRVIPQSRESFQSGLSLYAGRVDKGYSMTDCISMQTMRQEKIESVLSNDRHFEQEGFRVVFREGQS